LVLQAQEVFQKFLKFQVAKEMSTLQADTTLTDEEKAVAGLEQGLAYSGIGGLLKCLLRDLTGAPAPHRSFLSFCGIPMLLKMKKKKKNQKTMWSCGCTKPYRQGLFHHLLKCGLGMELGEFLPSLSDVV
jgi:hypothetical protein